VLKTVSVPEPTFEALKEYVGFDDTGSAVLREFRPLAQAHIASIVDDFYEAIVRHPGASAAITGGQAQIDRLKQTLVSWMEQLLEGPHDGAYFRKRQRIGRVHVQINLPQGYMFTAMDRIRVQLINIATTSLASDHERCVATNRALNQALDLELAIMLDTYREDLLARNRTAERLATIGHLAASIGHELRNPLGVIESSVYLMRHGLGQPQPDEDKVRRHLDKISTEVQRANHTITDLLELVRHQTLNPRPTTARELARAALAATPVPGEVEIVDRTDDTVVNCDPTQIARVLSNLILNAVQAMAGRGRIFIDAERVGDAARLHVRDDGPGVPEHLRERVFEALFTTKPKGTGLGLALCRRILEAHGGTLDLESTTPGASFMLTIPDSPAPRAT
jgi:two-component system sensor histidine kinase HydH